MDEEQDAAAPTHLLLSSYRAGPFISATTHELLQLGQRPALAAGVLTAGRLHMHSSSQRSAATWATAARRHV